MPRQAPHLGVPVTACCRCIISSSRIQLPPPLPKQHLPAAASGNRQAPQVGMRAYMERCTTLYAVRRTGNRATCAVRVLLAQPVRSSRSHQRLQLPLPLQEADRLLVCAVLGDAGQRGLKVTHAGGAAGPALRWPKERGERGMPRRGRVRESANRAKGAANGMHMATKRVFGQRSWLPTATRLLQVWPCACAWLCTSYYAATRQLPAP